MQIPDRSPLSKKTATSLEKEILSGRWKSSLPGYRKLCSIMNVSPRTMHAALKILIQREIILPTEKTKPYLIHPKVSHQGVDNNQKKSLLILTKKHHQTMDLVARVVSDLVASFYHRKGWTVDFESCPEFDKSKPGHVLKRMLANRADYIWVLIQAPYPIIKWCLENKLRIICLGGEIEELTPPLVATSLTQMISASNTHLANLGHSRICTLISFTSEQRRESIITQLTKDMAELDINYHPSYNLPIMQNSAQSLWETLQNLFSISPPSALIVTEVHQLATVYSFCMQNGLNIPDDLSIIVTQHSPILNWFQPKPAYFEYPVDKFAQQINRWIENYPSGEMQPVMSPSIFHPSESLKSYL